MSLFAAVKFLLTEHAKQSDPHGQRAASQHLDALAATEDSACLLEPGELLAVPLAASQEAHDDLAARVAALESPQATANSLSKALALGHPLANSLVLQPVLPVIPPLPPVKAV